MITREVPTVELQPGDRVSLPLLRKVRTVRSIEPSGYVNFRNEPILTVRYEEPCECPASPGCGHPSGNTAAPQSTWLVLREAC